MPVPYTIEELREGSSDVEQKVMNKLSPNEQQSPLFSSRSSSSPFSKEDKLNLLFSNHEILKEQTLAEADRRMYELPFSCNFGVRMKNKAFRSTVKKKSLKFGSFNTHLT